MPIFRDPDDVVLSVPYRLNAALVVRHPDTIASRSPKGEGFTDLLWGTLNQALQIGAVAAFLDRLGEGWPRRVILPSLKTALIILA